MPPANRIWFLKYRNLGDIFEELIKTMGKNILNYFLLFFLFLLPHLDSEVVKGVELSKLCFWWWWEPFKILLHSSPEVRWWTFAGLFDLFRFHYVSSLFNPLFCICLIFQLLSDLLICLHSVVYYQRWPNITPLWLLDNSIKLCHSL